MSYDLYRLKEGVDLSKQNSDNLFKAAELLSNQKIFGTASSILILSAEEIIKSYSLVLEIVLGNQFEVKRIIKNSKFKSENSYLYCERLSFVN